MTAPPAEPVAPAATTTAADAARTIAAHSEGTHGLDAENPWPGLESFHEGDAGFFRGREAETNNLLRLVRRERLTVLYGLSGLGKSSLIQAGLFPKLGDEPTLPVYLRLRYDDDAAPLREQVLSAIARAAQADGIEQPAVDSTRTLWEHFHRRGGGYWTADNHPVSPILVFDQFEELFTLGHETPERSARTERFIDELADLIEGRPPANVKARVDAGTDNARAFDSSRHGYKILLSLRADFFAQLETLRPRIPSVVSNRMELGPLRGDAALRVTAAGGALLAESLQERIVRVVADVKAANIELPLHELIVDPAILSLFCREVNERRKALGQATITDELVEGNRNAILGDFYARCVDDLDPAARRFIEERLLTVDGYRNSEALQNMLAVPGVTRAVVERLVARRLIRVDQPEGRPPRVELTHDVLASLVRKSRDARQAAEELARVRAESASTQASLAEARRQARRSRVTVTLMTVLTVASLAAGVFAWRESIESRQTAASVEMSSAAHALQDGDGPAALGWAADAMTLDAGSSGARSLALSLLGTRRWPLARIGGPAVADATYSPDGTRIVTASSDHTARIWDAVTGVSLTPEMGHQSGVRVARFSPDGRLVVTASDDNTAQVWDARTGAPHGKPLTHSGPVYSVAFDPTGTRVVTASGAFTAKVWDATTGDSVGPALRDTARVYTAEFSPDGKHIPTFRRKRRATVGCENWRTNRRPPASPRLRRSAVYSPDGTRALTSSSDSTARVWDLSTGTTVGLPMRHTGTILSAAFSANGQRVVTASADSTARVWDAMTGARIGAPLHESQMVLRATFSPDGRRILLATLGQRASVWSAEDRPALATRPALLPTEGALVRSLEPRRSPRRNGLRRWHGPDMGRTGLRSCVAGAPARQPRSHRSVFRRWQVRGHRIVRRHGAGVECAERRPGPGLPNARRQGRDQHRRLQPRRTRGRHGIRGRHRAGLGLVRRYSAGRIFASPRQRGQRRLQSRRRGRRNHLYRRERASLGLAHRPEARPDTASH